MSDGTEMGQAVGQHWLSSSSAPTEPRPHRTHLATAVSGQLWGLPSTVPWNPAPCVTHPGQLLPRDHSVPHVGLVCDTL